VARTDDKPEEGNVTLTWQCIASCPETEPHSHEGHCSQANADGMHVFGNGSGYKSLPDGVETDDHVDYQCNECGAWIAFT
jgi:hypothetical protein